MPMKTLKTWHIAKWHIEFLNENKWTRVRVDIEKLKECKWRDN